MNKKSFGVLVSATLLIGCEQPLETMDPPDWAKVAPTPPTFQVADVRPKLEPSLVESKLEDADVIVDVRIRLPGRSFWSRDMIPMKHQLVPEGSISFPGFNVIGDGWDPDGTFSGGSGTSIYVLEASDDEVTVSVSMYWVHGSTDEGQCEGNVHVSMGSRVERAIKGGCEVEVMYRHPNERSNYRLKLTVRGRPTRAWSLFSRTAA